METLEAAAEAKAGANDNDIRVHWNDGHTTFWDRGWGVEDEIRGGEQNNVAFSLILCLNSNVRVMWNYVHADLDSPVYDGDLNIFQTRLQLAF